MQVRANFDTVNAFVSSTKSVMSDHKAKVNQESMDNLKLLKFATEPEYHAISFKDLISILKSKGRFICAT